MRNRNCVIFALLTLFGAAMAMGYFWIFTSIAQSTVHGIVHYAKVPPLDYLRTNMAVIRSRRVLNSALKKDGIRDLEIVKKQQDPIEWLERSLQVKSSDDSTELRISLTGPDSHELAQIVNAVLDAYEEVLTASEKRQAELEAKREADRILEAKLEAKREVDRIAAAARRRERIIDLEIEQAQKDFNRGLIPFARIGDLEDRMENRVDRLENRVNRVENRADRMENRVERFGRRDITIQHAKP